MAILKAFSLWAIFQAFPSLATWRLLPNQWLGNWVDWSVSTCPHFAGLDGTSPIWAYFCAVAQHPPPQLTAWNSIPTMGWNVKQFHHTHLTKVGQPLIQLLIEIFLRFTLVI